VWLAIGASCASAQVSHYANPREEYRQRIPVAAHDLAAQAEYQTQLPAAFSPWWQDELRAPIESTSNVFSASLDELILRALVYSSQIKVFSDLPLIRETAVTEARAAFDWRLFLDTRWDDISDPVGNILTTGGSPRYHDHLWSSSAGVSRRNVIGGSFETSQRIGHENNNSNFFSPNNQGTSRWSVSYTQPLMRGGGQVYNRSLIVLAQIDTAVAGDEFSRQLQSHLLEIARAYWALYLERGSLLQKRRLLQRGETIGIDLHARAGVDAVKSQLVRVQAAVAQRRSELIRAEMAVRNSQDRLNALINDPELTLTESLELIPLEMPTRKRIQVDPAESLHTALDRRPELNQSLRQIRAASVRLGMSRNELLPQLDVVLETYVSGLRGNSSIGNAWLDQFRVGDPSYSAGLTYQVPIGRRAASARLRRRQLEMRQLQNQFRATVETLLLEVKVAIREVETGYQEMIANYHAMRAASEEVDYIEQRWRHLGAAERSVNLYLEDLLRAQERLAASEFAFLKAETTYGLSLINLKRANGTLLQAEGVEMGRGCENGLPKIYLDKAQVLYPSAGDSAFSAGIQPSLPRIKVVMPKPSYCRNDFEMIEAAQVTRGNPEIPVSTSSGN
jgi:outer membrane protein TolC